MQIFVTGGSGFLGRRVIPLLVAGGHEVWALARSREAARAVAALGAIAIDGDLDRPASVDEALRSTPADVLVSLASLGFGHAPTVVAAAEDAGMHRALFVSTTSIFTRLPARSRQVRVEAERVIQASSLAWTILRPTMIYGGLDDRNMARLLRLARRSPVVVVPGHGRALQQPVHVEDLAAAIVTALGRPGAIGKIYDLAGPAPLTLREVIEQAYRAAGRRPRVLPVPLAPAVAALRLYERLTPRPRLRAEQLERIEEDKAFDISAARRDLGFDPRPFDTGISEEAMLLAAAGRSRP
ncbi:SDR family oxidoreductase [Rhabdothermincola sp.]|uniref:SDR family oxidoreductase n=1 Tax=Rhabdothermincola sp. TaxID=2820405 RepID=UPI002FE182C7